YPWRYRRRLRNGDRRWRRGRCRPHRHLGDAPLGRFLFRAVTRGFGLLPLCLRLALGVSLALQLRLPLRLGLPLHFGLSLRFGLLPLRLRLALGLGLTLRLGGLALALEARALGFLATLLDL